MIWRAVTWWRERKRKRAAHDRVLERYRAGEISAREALKRGREVYGD